MTYHDLTHGKAGEGVTATSGSPNKGSPDADAYRFRAPRGGDLVVCPYCDADELTRCDHCGDEGVMYADDIIRGTQ